LLLLWLFFCRTILYFFGTILYQFIYRCGYNFLQVYLMYFYCYAFSVLGIPIIGLFCALFVCKCVFYYCHRVSPQLHLTNISYPIILLGSLTFVIDSIHPAALWPLGRSASKRIEYQWYALKVQTEKHFLPFEKFARLVPLTVRNVWRAEKFFPRNDNRTTILRLSIPCPS